SAEIDASANRQIGPSTNRQLAKDNTNKKQSAQCHRHLARLRRIIQCWNEPAITRRPEHCQIIGSNSPPGCLGEHINIPVTPAPLKTETLNRRQPERMPQDGWRLIMLRKFVAQAKYSTACRKERNKSRSPRQRVEQ